MVYSREGFLNTCGKLANRAIAEENFDCAAVTHATEILGESLFFCGGNPGTYKSLTELEFTQMKRKYSLRELGRDCSVVVLAYCPMRRNGIYTNKDVQLHLFRYSEVSDTVVQKVYGSCEKFRYVESVVGDRETFLQGRFAQQILEWHKPLNIVHTPGTDVYMAAIRNGEVQFTNIGRETSKFIPENYSEEVRAQYNYVLEQLTSKDPTGRLAIFVGEPGTGKTRAIRSLIAQADNRCNVVIVPADMIGELGGPKMIPALLHLRYKPILLILEDADSALIPRGKEAQTNTKSDMSALSTLLNCSDGMLGAVLDLRAIISSNVQVDAIDAALLRPGRLLARVDIGELDKSTAMHIIRRESGLPIGTISSYLAKPLTEAIKKMAVENRGSWTPLMEAHHKEVSTWWGPNDSHRKVSLAACYEIAQRLTAIAYPNGKKPSAEPLPTAEPTEDE